MSLEIQRKLSAYFVLQKAMDSELFYVNFEPSIECHQQVGLSSVNSTKICGPVVAIST